MKDRNRVNMSPQRPPTPYPVFRKSRSPPEEEKQEKNEVVEYAKDMLQKSMLTGVPQIVTAPTKRSQVFKTFVVLGSFTGFLYQTSAFLVIYFSYPTLVDVQVTTPPYVDVPAITICNRNGLRRNEYCRLKPEKCEEMEVPRKFCEDFPETCEESRLKSGNLFPTKEARMEETSVTQEVIGKAGHEVYPLVSSCSFTGINVNFDFCNNSTFQSFMFEDLKGKMKKCYILNALWAKALLNLPQVPTRTVLKLTIDLEPDEYFDFENKPKGQMALHSPWNILNPFDEGLPISPGKLYIIQINEDIKNLLPWPYQTNCTDYIETWKARGRNGPLSKEMCIEECILNQTMDHCHCVLTNNLYPHNFKFCSGGSASKVLKKSRSLNYSWPTAGQAQAKKSIPASETDLCTDKVNFTHCFVKCSPACHDRNFGYTVREDSIEEDVRMSNVSRINWNRTVELFVVFKRTQVNIYRYRAKYEVLETGEGCAASCGALGNCGTNCTQVGSTSPQESIELFSFLGGFIGIWLGVSLIALLDFLESLATFTVFLVDRVKSSPRISDIRSAINSRLGSRNNSIASTDTIPWAKTSNSSNHLRVDLRRGSNGHY